MPVELALAGTCYAAALVCCAGSWRAILPVTLPLGDALSRYGVGSLANSFLPAHAGDAIRVRLFGNVVPGGMLVVAGAVAAVGTARWLAVVPLGIAGALQSSVSPLALGAAALAIAPLPIVWILARRGSRRARTVLEPLRRADAATYRALGVWVGGTVLARIAGAALVGAAFGVDNPLGAALLVVPALELACVLPLTPANVGIAGGATALAFHAHGVDMRHALAIGFALHAVETVTSVVVGALGGAALLRRSLPHRHTVVAAS